MGATHGSTRHILCPRTDGHWLNDHWTAVLQVFTQPQPPSCRVDRPHLFPSWQPLSVRLSLGGGKELVAASVSRSPRHPQVLILFLLLFLARCRRVATGFSARRSSDRQGCFHTQVREVAVGGSLSKRMDLKVSQVYPLEPSVKQEHSHVSESSACKPKCS